MNQHTETVKKEIQLIKKLATHFRNAIEMAKEKDEFISITPFSRFPRGCCGEASDLLAQYLLENNIETYYVCGTFFYDDNSYNSISHAWLKTREVIIDISGDQFKYNRDLLYYDKPVYVGKADKFHKLFEIDEKRDVTKSKKINEYDDLAKNRLNYLYNIIYLYLNESSDIVK